MQTKLLEERMQDQFLVNFNIGIQKQFFKRTSTFPQCSFKIYVASVSSLTLTEALPQEVNLEEADVLEKSNSDTNKQNKVII